MARKDDDGKQPRKKKERPLGIEWNPEMRRIDELVPYQKNPRIASEEGMKDLDKSLEKFGLMQLITINVNGEIISGHRRYERLVARGIETVLCLVPERDLNDDEFREACVLLNHTRAGKWEGEALAELGSVEELLKWGFTQAELVDLRVASRQTRMDDNSLASGDAPGPDGEEPEVRLPSASVPGDIYEFVTDTGTHRVMCDSSTNAAAVTLLLGGVKINILWTDPPYGVDYQTGDAEEMKTLRRRTDGLIVKNDSLKPGEYKQFFEAFLSAALPHLADYNTYYISMSGQELHNLRLALDALGFNWGDYLVWVKDRFVLGRKDYNSQVEHIVYGWWGRHRFYGDATCRNVFDFDRPAADLSLEELREAYDLIREHLTDAVRCKRPGRSKEHPTMKPVKLVADQIAHGSDYGDVVYDAFGGSGTTLIAAEKEGRQARLMELDPHYVGVIIRRYVAWMRENGRAFTFRHVNGEQTLEDFAVEPDAPGGDDDAPAPSSPEADY